jgi:hypothetical protein
MRMLLETHLTWLIMGLSNDKNELKNGERCDNVCGGRVTIPPLDLIT